MTRYHTHILPLGGDKALKKTKTHSLFRPAVCGLTAYRCEGQGIGDDVIDRSFCQQKHRLPQLGAGPEKKTCPLSGGISKEL